MSVWNDEANRPSAPAAPDAYVFGPFRIDVGSFELRRDDQIVPLNARAFDTLLLLVRTRGRVVTKEELIRSIWPDAFVSEDSLTQIISAVRRALGDDPGQPRFIATVSRRGYRFIAPVAEVSSASVDAPLPPHAPVPRRTPAIATGQQTVASAQPPPVGRRAARWPLVVAGVAVVAALLILDRTLVPTAPVNSPGPLRFTQEMPAGSTLASGGILSPDSRYLAFVAHDEASGKTHLWVRALDAAAPRPLPGTAGALRPFWSPDSQSIGFFANDKIERIGVAADSPQVLASTLGARPSGGSWSPSGLILFSDSGLLQSVAASGGVITTVTTPDSSTRESAHLWPQFLPDGRHFLYNVVSMNAARAGTYVASLDSGDRVRLLDGSHWAVTYAPTGYLLSIRERVLIAQRFDAARLRLDGDPITIAGNVPPTTVISASADGLLAFGGGTSAERLTWFDRAGRSLGTLNLPTVLHNLTLSPDQTQLMGSSAEPDQSGVWLVDLDRSGSTRVASEAASPLWSPDGAQIAFSSAGGARAPGIYARRMVGRNEDELLMKAGEPVIVNDWSRDGRYIVFISANLRTRQDVWLLPRFGDRKPVPFVQTPANEIQAQVSPDGRWLAYTSDESGTWDVYVESFPFAGTKRTISVGGGAEPQWRSDGKELFYVSPDHLLMAVDVRLGDLLQVGPPKALFRVPIPGTLSDYRNHYTVTPDGQRFVIDVVDAASQEPLTVMVNWQALASGKP